MPVLLLCQCGSDRVHIANWNGRRARIKCYMCNRESWLDKLTLADFEPAKSLSAAFVDQAHASRAFA